MQDIQYLGALNTYYKRYLYLNAFGITDGEVIDSLDNKEIVKKNNEVTPKDFMEEMTIQEGQKQNIKGSLKEEDLNKFLEKLGKSSLDDLTYKEAYEIEKVIDKKRIKNN